MNKTLSNYFSFKRRYSRSINLERDWQKVDTLAGYIPTERAIYATKRILTSLIGASDQRAWTLTSVYGTGKSAFAHFLASLCTAETSNMHQKAIEIASQSFIDKGFEYLAFKENLPKQGFFVAVATAQREPLSNTIIRALARGVQIFWTIQEQNKIRIARKLVDLDIQIAGGLKVDSREILPLIKEVSLAASTGILLIIDELGKNLEFAVQNQGGEDLYILQQLAELPRKKGEQVYIVGLLHQAFADYAQRLAAVQLNEWSKIQGRFEDISFKDSSAQMMHLIGEVIDKSQAEMFHHAIDHEANEWLKSLPNSIKENYTKQLLEDIYPLHPLTAFALPNLCTRYAQNDRSLFTFLTSEEPYSCKNFLRETQIEENTLPTLRLDRIYDYFIEAIGNTLASRPNLQRWVEIQNLIGDIKGKDIDDDHLKVLKTIGILNLITTRGAMSATRTLVKLAMCQTASNQNHDYWEQVIDNLIQKGIITHFRQADELRIWQGSDFNVDLELTNYLEQEQSPLSHLLSNIRPLTPIVAQRHSYKTGTLRYFERCYLDSLQDLVKLRCSKDDCDGLVGYWVDEGKPANVPNTTADGKPLVILAAAQLDILRIRARELAALKKIQTSAAELQTDGVARLEVRYRLVIAEQLLDETLSQAFDVGKNQNLCWIQGQKETISHVTDFNVKLSDICDQVYSQGLILWNELINRRELTSQGAKARRELIEAMLEYPEKEKLGLEGFEPKLVCTIQYYLKQVFIVWKMKLGDFTHHMKRLVCK